MAKTITFSDIKLQNIELCEVEGKVFAYITYALKEEDGKIWETKRYVLKDEDFTATQKQKIKQILNVAYKKIKSIEKI